jgi:hypothetical protein
LLVSDCSCCLVDPRRVGRLSVHGDILQQPSVYGKRRPRAEKLPLPAISR